jgi:hypothetical protein
MMNGAVAECVLGATVVLVGSMSFASQPSASRLLPAAICQPTFASRDFCLPTSALSLPGWLKQFSKSKML